LLVTNVFADTDIRQALSDVASETGAVIIPDATVQGVVSADLADVPLEDALRMLLVAGGYVFKKMPGYYLVGAADPTNPNFYLLSETEVVELKYVTGSAISAYLTGPYGKFVTIEGGPPPRTERERQRPGYDQRTTPAQPTAGTRLFLTAPREIINRIKADLALIDQPRTQVMLEAAVVEVSEEALKEIGIDWATTWTKFTSRGSTMRSENQTSSLAAEALPASSLTYSQLSFTQMARLQALVQTGKAHLRANPRVATLEGQTAEIEVGQEKYFAIITGPVTFPYTTLEQIPSGITLRITPTVVEETGEVVAQVEPEVRDVTGSGSNGLPEITFRRAVTNVRVRDGESILIGGLINEFSTYSSSKFPILGDLPLLGHLFRHTASRRVRTETIITVTPHVLGASPGAQPAPLPLETDRQGPRQ
jgi:type II secretory pathway component GspD/PulD (secretin)